MLTVLTGDDACTGKAQRAPPCLHGFAGGPGISAWRMGHPWSIQAGHRQLLYLLQHAAAWQATSCPVTPARTSARLAKAAPEFKDGLADDYVDGDESGDGAGPTARSLGVNVTRWSLNPRLLLPQDNCMYMLLGKTAGAARRARRAAQGRGGL